MSSSLLIDKIVLIQKEYKELLISLLPKLKSRFAAEALDEINIFWLRRINIVRLYLETVVPYNDSYVFTVATFLDYDDNEHLPFLLLGENHLLDDPLSRYSELCCKMPERRDADFLYEQIKTTAEDNIKILENLHSSLLIIPLRLLSQSKADDILFQNSEQLFLGLFNGIDSIGDYFIKCDSIDDIIKYARDDTEKIVMFSETDNKALPFKERFYHSIADAEFMTDPAKSDAFNFFSMVFGNIHQAISILVCCLEYGCIPYIRYPVSFHYLNTISNSILESSQINILQFKMSVAFLLYKLCDKSQLSSIDSNDFLFKKQSYGFNDKLFKRFDLQKIEGGNGFDISIKKEINEELECFYKYISNE